MPGKSWPFLYGSEYYRAPTPDRKYWADDLRRMADHGFNAVKFFVQWRWVHRGPDRWFFEDHDELMGLAGKAGLSVTINLIFDTSPVWLFDQYPDAYMITAEGQRLESKACSCRAIGGYPGPCLNHPGAWTERERFLRQVVDRYGQHPAMGMWDVWNEPESNLYLRKPDNKTLVCYCEHCRLGFLNWLKEKYTTVERLNDVWGRCYPDFSQVELPRDRHTFTDMVDWRLFCLDSLAGEGKRRIESTRSADSVHPVYLHPVPNTWHFNAVTGVDTFQMAQGCDCFAGSVLGSPLNPLHLVSAADGRVCYSAETHVRSGMTGMYPRDLAVKDFAWELVPQIGLGIRGFLYWQYRCETLGMEAPGWGLLDPNGQPGLTHAAASEFWKRIRPVADRLMAAPVEPAEAAIYQSSAGEIFHWCMNGDFTALRTSVEQFTHLLYERNVRVTYVNDRLVQAGLPKNIKLLILPMSYALDEATAKALIEWVIQGGTLLCQGLTGGFNLTAGRHSMVAPGLGMAEAFDLAEVNPTATVYLHLGTEEIPYRLTADVCGAFQRHEREGGNLLPLVMENGGTIWGRLHYTELGGKNIEKIAGLPGRPACIGFKQVGKGTVFYIGTVIDWAKHAADPTPLLKLLEQVLRQAHVEQECHPWSNVPVGVRIDRLKTNDGEAFTVTNKTAKPAILTVTPNRKMRGVFTGKEIEMNRKNEFVLPAGEAEIVAPVSWF
jgi:beta-galactosidase